MLPRGQDRGGLKVRQQPRPTPPPPPPLHPPGPGGGQGPAWPVRRPAGVTSAFPGHRLSPPCPPVPVAAAAAAPRGGGSPAAGPAGSVLPSHPLPTPRLGPPRTRRGQRGGGAEPGAPEQAAIAVCWLPPSLPRARPGVGESRPAPGREVLRGAGGGCWIPPKRGRGRGGRGGGAKGSLAPGTVSAGPQRAQGGAGRAGGGTTHTQGKPHSCLGDLAAPGSRV